MLHFIENSDKSSAVDTETQELEQYIRKVKLDPEVRRGLVTFGDYIDRECREAADKAKSEAKIEERVECILDLLSERGEISPELEARLYAQNDMECLKKLLKLVAHVESVEEFEVQMDEVLKNTMAPV